MSPRGFPGWHARLTLVSVLALVVAACASNQSAPSRSAPPPSAAPAATPTPTPSAGDAVLARLQDPGLTARVTISGTETVPSGYFMLDDSGSPIPGPSIEPLVLTWEGEAYLSGTDYLLRLQVVDQPGLVIEELRVGNGVRRRSWNHPWQKMPTAQDDVEPKLFALLAGLQRLEPLDDSGTGERVRFRAPSTTELSLVTLFMQEEAAKEPDTGTVEIEAEPDGAPVRVAISLTSDDLDYSEAMPEGMKAPPRTYEFEFAFDVVDRVPLPELEPPTVPVAVQSRFGLRFEHPLDWAFDTTQDEYDEAIGGDSVIRIFSYPIDGEWAGFERDELLDQFAASLIKDMDMGQPASVERTTVAGRPAYIVAMRSEPDSSEPFFHLEAAFVGEETMHAIAWHAFHLGTELNERYAFERMLETVQLDPS